MKTTLCIACVSLVCTPLVAYASIQVTNVSSSHTGGVSAGSGETVSSSDSSASSEIITIIKGGSGGGSADVHITTEQNGIVQTETRHENFAPGEPIIVNVATSSTSRPASAGVSEEVRTSSTTATSTATSTPKIFSRPWFKRWIFPEESSATTSSRSGAFFGLQNVFKAIFGLFTGF